MSDKIDAPPPSHPEQYDQQGGFSEQQHQQRPPRATDRNASFLRAARAGNLDQVLDFLRNGIDINTCNTNGLNALHLASKEGHGVIVRELIRRGAAVDAATRKGNTALHIASLAGQDVVVTILVENNANVNTQSLNGFTPLYMASQENHENVVRYLLSHGANPALSTEDGFTPLAVALQQGHDRIVALLLENDNTSKVKLPALHIAAKKDDVRAATLLLQNEQNPNITSKSGFTPLHIAAHYGNEAIAQLLLEKGANVNFQARHNISPLHVAAKWGRPNLCTALLTHGAAIDCRTRDLLTALHCAARSGHDQVVELLLAKGAPIAAKTKNGLAPLHMAAQGNHVGCARILLYNKAEVDEVTVDYLTALHVAAHCGHVEVAKLLLDRNADPNARALNGFTPLHIACKKNRIKVVELLLKYHAAIEATTESGLTPLHVASFMGCINIVIFLIQQGANVDCVTVRGETPLHLAARANQTDIVRVLVRNKANVDAQARELQTPLHIASRLGNADIAMILLSANADVNAATKDQYTPLHIAAKEGQEELAQLLLDRKANKTLLTRKGFAPIHLAAKYANYSIVRLLLDHGTPVDLEGKNMVTPLHVAAHYNNQSVAQLLLERKAKAQASAKNGYTALHIAAKKNQMEIASSLLAFRANPNAESRAGFTPLHLASEEGHQEMAALLIEASSRVDACAKNGLAPMHLCAQEDHVPVAAELFKNGASLNAQTNALYTPLHVACHFGQFNMVRFLVENGALINAETKAGYTPLHQAAQQGHNHLVRYLLEHGASPNSRTQAGQTPLSIAQRLGYVSIVETLKTVTETTVITETTTVTEERYKPQNPEAMNETMFSDSEDEADDHQAAVADHARDFNESITQGLRDSAVVHLMADEHKGASPFDSTEADLEALIKKAQNEPILTAIPDSSYLIENGHDDIDTNVVPREFLHPSFLISFLVDARGGAMRGSRHSGIRVIVPPRKAPAPIRITCRYLKKEKLSHSPPLSEGEALASRILEMGPSGAKFLGPVILEVPHFASLRGREREIVILRSDDGQHWKEHQLEATEDAVQEVLNESFDASELQQLDELHTPRITRILTNNFPMYFAVVTRVRQEVHCVGPDGGVILSSVVSPVQAIFPDGSLTKTIKVSLQAQPVPTEIVKLHGNRVAVSPIVTVEPRRRKFHKPITLFIPLPSHGQKGAASVGTAQSSGGEKQQQESPTLRLLCSITGGSAPAHWEDITGTTQLTFTRDEVSFTTTVSARFWLMDYQNPSPKESAHIAQEIYNEAIAVPYMSKFIVFGRRPYPVEGQLRIFCITDDKENKTLEMKERFVEIARSREVEVLSNRHQFLEFAGNIVPVTKRGDQLSMFFLPFQENRLAFNVKVRSTDDEHAASTGKIAVMKEPRLRSENLLPQHPICTLAITLPNYSGPLPMLQELVDEKKKDQLVPITVKYAQALAMEPQQAPFPMEFVARRIGLDWARLARSLGLLDSEIRQIKREFNSGSGQEPMVMLKIWQGLRGEGESAFELEQALRRIGRDDIVRRMHNKQLGELDFIAASMESEAWRAIGTPPRSHSQQQFKPATIAASTVREPPHLETVVTRTERHVHQLGEADSEGKESPIVDERTVTKVYHGDQEMQDHGVVVERTALPLTVEEAQRWGHGPSDVEDERLFANSREAMIIDGAERHLEDGGVMKSTTLVSQHVIFGSDAQSHQQEEMVEGEGPFYHEEEKPSFVEDDAGGDHSPMSSGSVVIKEEEMIAEELEPYNVQPVIELAPEHQFEMKAEPMMIVQDEETEKVIEKRIERRSDSVEMALAERRSYDADEVETTTGGETEPEAAVHTDGDDGGSASFDPTISGGAKTLDQQEPAAVQRRESSNEMSSSADSSQFVSKRTVTTVSTSQSGISGLEGYGQIPPRLENAEESRLSSDDSSSTRSSVRDRVAMFESMKIDESGTTKFGWRGVIQPFQTSSKSPRNVDEYYSEEPEEETTHEYLESEEIFVEAQMGSEKVKWPKISKTEMVGEHFCKSTVKVNEERSYKIFDEYVEQMPETLTGSSAKTEDARGEMNILKPAEELAGVVDESFTFNKIQMSEFEELEEQQPVAEISKFKEELNDNDYISKSTFYQREEAFFEDEDAKIPEDKVEEYHYELDDTSIEPRSFQIKQEVYSEDHEEIDMPPVGMKRDTISLETDTSSIVTVIHKSDQEEENEVEEKREINSRISIEDMEIRKLEEREIERLGTFKDEEIKVETENEFEHFKPSERLEKAETELGHERGESAVVSPKDSHQEVDAFEQKKTILGENEDGDSPKTRSLYKKLKIVGGSEVQFQRGLSVDEERITGRQNLIKSDWESQKTARSQSLTHRPIIEIIPPEDGDREQWQIAEQDFVPSVYAGFCEERGNDEDSSSDTSHDDFIIVESEDVEIPPNAYTKIQEPPMKLHDEQKAEQMPIREQFENKVEDEKMSYDSEKESPPLQIKSEESIERNLHAKAIVQDALASAVAQVNNDDVYADEDNKEVVSGSTHEQPQELSSAKIKMDFGGYVPRQKLSIEELKKVFAQKVVLPAERLQFPLEVEIEIEKEADEIVRDALDSVSQRFIETNSEKTNERDLAEDENEESRIEWEDNEDDEEEEEELVELAKTDRQNVEDDDQEEDDNREEGVIASPFVTYRTRESDLLMPSMTASPFQRPRSPIPPSYVETPPILKHTRMRWPAQGDDRESPCTSSPAEMFIVSDATGETLMMESENERLVPHNLEYEAETSSKQEQQQNNVLLGDSEIEYPLVIPDREDVQDVEDYRRQSPAEEKQEIATDSIVERFLEEGDSSLGSSPVKKHTNNGRGSSGENISVGESSLLEFEQLEMEIRSKSKEPETKSIDEAKAYASHQTAGSISGSMGSLVEFENIERDVQDQLNKEATEEIMILSDIREESEEAEELEINLLGEDEEDEAMDQREDLVEYEEELLKADKRVAEEVMKCSTDSLEIDSRLQMMETSQDSLENPDYNKYANIKSSIEGMDKDSLQEEESDRDARTEFSPDETSAKRQHSYESFSPPEASSFPSAKEASFEEHEVSETVFESIFKNKKGEDERIVRRVKIKHSDPVYSKVKFTGTENEQEFMGIVEGKTEMEVVDIEGNVTNINVTKM